MLEQNELKRDWLLRWRVAVMKWNAAEDDLEEVCAVGSRAITYTDMPHGSPELTGLEATAIRAENALAVYKSAIDNAHTVRIEIRTAIDQLPEAEGLVLFYRYLALKRTDFEQRSRREGTRQLTWDEIADRMGYSRDRVAHIHGEALQHLQVPATWLAHHSIL